MEQLNTQLQQLKQQLAEIDGFLAGEESPTVAQQILGVKQQQANIKNQISQLNAQLTTLSHSIPTLAHGNLKPLLEAISQQRWYYFKDKTHVLYDSHTGYLWPNLEYVTLPTVEQGLQNSFQLNDLGLGEWQTHTPTLLDSIAASYPHKNVSTWFWTSRRDSGESHCKQLNGGNNWLFNNNVYYLPYCPLFANPDIAPHVNNFTPLEKAQKVLDLFLEQGWQPIFSTEEHNETYKKIQQRPSLLAALQDLEQRLHQALEQQKNDKQPLSGQFNYLIELQHYHCQDINQSSLKYAQALQQWATQLLIKLDEFCQQHSPLMAIANQLHQRLHSDISINDSVADDLPLLVARDEYLQQQLNFDLNVLRQQLLNFVEQGLALQQQLLASANSTHVLSQLATIQQSARPTFEFVAEYTSYLVTHYINKLEWLQANQQTIQTLVEIHYQWLVNFDEFTSKDYAQFMALAQKERIDNNLAEIWFSEWRQQRRIIETQLLPLYQLAFNQQCDLQTAIDTTNALQRYQQAIDQFYKKERLACHQRYAFTTNGQQQEQYETQLQLFKLASQFESDIEKILFALPNMATRMQLLRWSEAMTQQHFNQLHQQTELCVNNDTWQTIRAELRQLQQRSLETFIQDMAYFSQERKKRDDELNSLIYKMRKELQTP